MCIYIYNERVRRIGVFNEGEGWWSEDCVICGYSYSNRDGVEQCEGNVTWLLKIQDLGGHVFVSIPTSQR